MICPVCGHTETVVTLTGLAPRQDLLLTIRWCACGCIFNPQTGMPEDQIAPEILKK